LQRTHLPGTFAAEINQEPAFATAQAAREPQAPVTFFNASCKAFTGALACH